ncbi:oligopeptide/dipeptide ABC transporter ATP-binding protein [Martelella sp. HB161492]|uniref:ABC transporter ATP-binding protein n=1 Tax=Martelella sp. HB161492 TaxID=2720726 RepID=UPI001FEE49B0|nr:oligopeptide/dipeptide ABC transporter ATP-binding protein [Martelella sp. HB161492]
MTDNTADTTERMPPRPVIETVDLRTHFRIGRGKVLKAVDGISLSILPGRTLALVGESGSGKSTYGRTIAQLEGATSGAILLEGHDIAGARGRELRHVYERLQMVFQNPMTSLSPRFSIRRTLTEPLKLHKRGDATEREARARALLAQVGLREDFLGSYPGHMSGGQRQRIGIARALALEPKLIIADEPTASLDVSTQAQVINLMLKLQRDLDLAYLFITHDLRIARHISHDTAVMYLGKVVEKAPTASLFAAPAHPYTAGLVARRRPGEKAGLTGSVPSQIDRPAGCHFAGRCPLATDLCRREYPEMRMWQPGHIVACHRAGEIANVMPPAAPEAV